MEYGGIICELKNVRPHPNADRLQLATCVGNQVVVGLEHKDGDIGIYFGDDGQLSDKFCVANNLYPIFGENGERIGGGFFDRKHRRVRAQNFRGERSYGFWCPMEYLNFTGYDLSKLNIGDIIHELNGRDICNKYYNPATRQIINSKRVNNRKETTTFKVHQHTKQFRYFVESIPTGAFVTITGKLHGTSGRTGHVLEDIQVPKWKSFISNLLGTKVQNQVWTYLNGTRNVIIEKRGDNNGFYGTDEFRMKAASKFIDNLHKGEQVYYEIVGWVDEDRPIMPPVPTNVIKDKQFVEQYGSQMLYKYGCPPGNIGVYVYRITHCNPDGRVYELPWDAVKQRCQELGVDYVPEVVPTFKFDGDHEGLQKLVESITEGPDFIDQSHIREGVCIRVDNGMNTAIYKNKSFNFLLMEGVIKDGEENVDIEEIS